MFDVIRFKELVKERDETHSEYTYGLNLVWEKLTDLICEDLDASIKYILNDCTSEEFIWLSEFFEAVIEKTLSQDYIDALRIVTKKYPEETKLYNINAFIDDAQGRLNYLLNPED